ncbi:uncharacterized protein LOC135494800 isoform X2 [Lineus longissimus]|uniref:uncharacterized protein LOC135494800 isoform X2 n=1 Tax=Lineus longissimus TaxID=88925 RepID=UPI002B4F041E
MAFRTHRDITSYKYWKKTMSDNTASSSATTSPKYCNCCKSENCRGRALAAWGFKMVTIIADWFKRTFPSTFNKMLEGMKDKNEECRQTFAKIFSLSDSQLPWKQDAAETDTETKQPPESPEFKRSHAYTGGFSEEEQTAKALEESIKEHQEANLLYRHLATAPPSEPPSYDSIYSDQGGIPAAYIPPAPPSTNREETEEVIRQRRLYPQL